MLTTLWISQGLILCLTGTAKERGLHVWQDTKDVQSEEESRKKYECYDMPFGNDAIYRCVMPMIASYSFSSWCRRFLIMHFWISSWKQFSFICWYRFKMLWNKLMSKQKLWWQARISLFGIAFALLFCCCLLLLRCFKYGCWWQMIYSYAINKNIFYM